MSKYGSRKTTIDNIAFDSMAEAAHYKKLKMLKAAKQIKDFELQPEFELLAPFKKSGITHRGIKYKADFRVEHLDGSIEIIDVKGLKTEVYRIKKKLFESKYPELTITEVSV